MPNRLRIITYNIHRCIGGDHKLSPERISDVIADYKPDVVALQEVDSGQVRPTLYSQADIIAGRLSSQKVWIELERCGNAIISRYPMKIVKAGGLRRTRRWHTFARRGALWVEVEAYGARIQIINTHLGLTATSRLNQGRILCGSEWLGNLACQPPIILCGDFNTQPGSTVFRLLGKKLNSVEVLSASGRLEKTWPSVHPLLNLDHMFISDGLTVEAVTVLDNELTRIASDHLPYIVDLRLSDATVIDI